MVADEVRLSGQLLQSGDFTHLLNHSALQAFNKLNQAVDIFSAVGLTFELIQAIADTERSLRLGEFMWRVMGAASPSNPVKHFAGSANISQGRTNSIGKIL